MKLSFLSGAACAAALLASTSVAQNKLTTLFAGGNGLSGSAAVYFDITVNSTVIVSDFEINSWATAQTAIDLQVYTTPNTYLGNEGNQSVWTQVAQDNGSAVAAGQGTPSVIKLQQALILQPGTYGMALVSNGGHSYTDGTGSNQNYSDNFLSLQLGASSSPPFGGSPFTPRVWNGSIIYNPANGIFANFSATPVEGKSPLQVQFTDTTYSSDPNGVTKWEWDFNNDQIVDSTAQNPQFTFTGVGYDVKYTVSLKATDGSNGSSTETKKDFIIVNPFPVASATQFGQGSTVPGGVPGPMQMPAFSNTYSWPTDTRGFWGQAPTTFVITGFNVPNENQDTHHSVWFFTYSGTGTPGSTYNVTATDTKFIGSGPISATLKPQTPITVTQGTWFGCLGTTHDATGTTMSNSYAASGTQQTTILGSPVSLNRLTHTGSIFNGPGTGSVSFATAGQIARVLIDIPGNLQTTIPTLAASGDTPYFGANPQLDMTAAIPGAQAGLLAGSLQSLPVSIPTPFGGLLISPSFLITFVVPNGTGSVQLPIPNDPNFADAHIYWQGIVFDLTNNVYGMTNGVDWLIGQQ